MAIIPYSSPVFYGLDNARSSHNTNFGLTAGQRIFMAFLPPKTGSIDRVCIRQSNTATSGSAFTFRLETVQYATTVTDPPVTPTGTLVDVNAQLTGTMSSTSQAWKEFSFPSAIPVNISTMIACVMAQSSGTVGVLECTRPYRRGLPVVALWTGSSYSNLNFLDGLMFQFRYTDGTYPHYLPMGVRDASIPLSSPRIGNRISLPYAYQVSGIWSLQSSPSTVCNLRAKLYDDTTLPSGTPIRTSRIHPRNESKASSAVSPNSGFVQEFYFTPYNVPANTWMKYIVEFESTTTGMVHSRSVLGANDNVSAISDFTECFGYGKGTTFVQDTSGSWVTDQTQIMQMGPIITGFDDGSGGIRLPMAMNGGYSA